MRGELDLLQIRRVQRKGAHGPPGQVRGDDRLRAYGLIVVQGHGTLGAWDVETPTLIRYGQRTFDEFFVSEAAAREGWRCRTVRAPNRW